MEYVRQSLTLVYDSDKKSDWLFWQAAYKISRINKNERIFQRISVNDKYVYATNGNVLLWFETSYEIPNGDYSFQFMNQQYISICENDDITRGVYKIAGGIIEEFGEAKNRFDIAACERPDFLVLKINQVLYKKNRKPVIPGNIYRPEVWCNLHLAKKHEVVFLSTTACSAKCAIMPVKIAESEEVEPEPVE